MPRFVVTGAPGTGKTAVLDLLSSQFEVVPEPARELVAEHLAATAEATLDHRPEVFVEGLITRSIEKYHSVGPSEVSFFDRGLPDCVAYARAIGVDPYAASEHASNLRYDAPVFMAPPWFDIYTTDDMRRATFQQVEEFHMHLVQAYDDLDYDLIELPKTPPAERAALIVDTIVS